MDSNFQKWLSCSFKFSSGGKGTASAFRIWVEVMLTAVEATVGSSEAGPERTYPNFVSMATGPCSPRITRPVAMCQKKSAPINISISRIPSAEELSASGRPFR